MHRAKRVVMMRPVDLFVELGVDDGKDIQRAQRAHRGMRVIGAAARAGRSGPKGNLVHAWVDAGLAVLDAIESYANYRQAVEVTRQLEAEADALRVHLAETRKQCAAMMEHVKREQEQRVRHIRSTMADQWDSMRIGLAHYKLCKDDVRRIGCQLELLRQTSMPSCPRLATLERCFHQLVAAQVAAALVVIDS